MHRQAPARKLPVPSTVSRILAREALVRSRRRFPDGSPWLPGTSPQGSNGIWATEYRRKFRLKYGAYRLVFTVSHLASHYLLGVDAHPAIALELTQKHFTTLFQEFGLPNRIRTDNGVPFVSSALARLSALSVRFTPGLAAGASVTLGIYPELIEPGRPQQNAIHERMHRTLKRDATIPPASSLTAQQRRFDAFRHGFNQLRPHESLAAQRPAQLYLPSTRAFSRPIVPYDYPSHFLLRRVSRVSRDGTIRVLRNQIFVSNTLHDDFVGLEEIDDGVFDLYFCFYQIGRYLLQANRIENIVSRVPVSWRQIDLARRESAMS